jgi:hypothetical protein
MTDPVQLSTHTMSARRRMYDKLVNALFADFAPEDRPMAALAWVATIQGTTAVDCWAGRCIHYVEPGGRIRSSIAIEGCECGERSARTVGELPKRPFPRKGKR